MLRALLAAVVVMAITAVGDTVSVAAAGTSNVQPPSGEVWLISEIGSGDSQNSAFESGGGWQLYDGTDVANAVHGYGTAVVVGGTHGGSTSGTGVDTRRSSVLSNTQYARFKNGDGATQACGYRGVKL